MKKPSKGPQVSTLRKKKVLGLGKFEKEFRV
jgi:hypothetical protein